MNYESVDVASDVVDGEFYWLCSPPSSTSIAARPVVVEAELSRISDGDHVDERMELRSVRRFYSVDSIQWLMDMGARLFRIPGP